MTGHEYISLRPSAVVCILLNLKKENINWMVIYKHTFVTDVWIFTMTVITLLKFAYRLVMQVTTEGCRFLINFDLHKSTFTSTPTCTCITLV